MEVLVVGGGGREHALAWKIKQSPKVTKVYCAPGNAGTASLGQNVKLAANDVDGLLDFAVERRIGLTVVGPEQPLVMGITDRFREKGLRVFGPSAKAARIESSKAFCKDLMSKYSIPTGDYKTFTSASAARDYIRGKGPLVIKADGLAAGKGVLICREESEGLRTVHEIMEQRVFGEAGEQVVIEEFLEGTEVSLLAFTDGKDLLPLDSAQDHKTAYDGDRGPNTGGMGAYSPAEIFSDTLKERVMTEIMYPVVRAMEAEGIPYQGLLYAGLMLTDTGPKVLEFNARFGDPETQPLMARLKTDLLDVMEASIDGSLSNLNLEWDDRYSVCVVMAAKGYPGSYNKGMEVTGLGQANILEGITVFHAGTRQEDDRVVTSGGRVLGVNALGNDLPSAIERAYEAVGKIKWNGIHFRKDIGRRGE